MVKRGVSRQLGAPPVQKLPLTVEILLKLHSLLDMSCTVDLSFWAAVLTGFFGLLRKSSLLPKTANCDFTMCLLRSDIVVMERDSFVLQIRKSKTNQFGQRILQLPFSACVDNILCPVFAMLRHLAGSKMAPDVPLFSCLIVGKVFHMTHATFVSKLKKCLERLGYPSAAYSGHSLRRGGCSFCYEAGLNAVEIKLRGDWKSMAFERYLFVSREKQFESSRMLADRTAFYLR